MKSVGTKLRIILRWVWGWWLKTNISPDTASNHGRGLGALGLEERRLRRDMAKGYQIMRVGDVDNVELSTRSFKIRVRSTRYMSRRLILKGNFFTQWAVAVRCWHKLLRELWRWMAPAGPEKDQPS